MCYNEIVYHSKFKIYQEIDNICAIHLSAHTLVRRVTFILELQLLYFIVFSNYFVIIYKYFL